MYILHCTLYLFFPAAASWHRGAPSLSPLPGVAEDCHHSSSPPLRAVTSSQPTSATNIVTKTDLMSDNRVNYHDKSLTFDLFSCCFCLWQWYCNLHDVTFTRILRDTRFMFKLLRESHALLSLMLDIYMVNERIANLPLIESSVCCWKSSM